MPDRPHNHDRGQWLVATGEGCQPAGPYTLAEIEVRLRRGELTLESRIWSEGMDGWEPVATVLRLSTVSAPKSRGFGVILLIAGGGIVFAILIAGLVAGMFWRRSVRGPDITAAPIAVHMQAAVPTPAPTPTPTPTPVPPPAFTAADGLGAFLARPGDVADPALRDFLQRAIDADDKFRESRLRLADILAEAATHDQQAAQYRDEAQHLVNEPGRAADRQNALSRSSAEQRQGALLRDRASKEKGMADSFNFAWAEAMSGLADRAREIGFEQLATDAAQALLAHESTPNAFRRNAEALLAASPKSPAATPVP